MAERLGFQTTAEGVESAETLAWVTALGCTQAQGHLFAKAMPAHEIESYLAAESGGEPVAARVWTSTVAAIPERVGAA